MFSRAHGGPTTNAARGLSNPPTSSSSRLTTPGQRPAPDLDPARRHPGRHRRQVPGPGNPDRHLLLHRLLAAGRAPRHGFPLCDPHRFNVATSRARGAVIVVASRALFEANCRTSEQMRGLMGFAGIGNWRAVLREIQQRWHDELSRIVMYCAIWDN
jgi:hypothetical protein